VFTLKIPKCTLNTPMMDLINQNNEYWTLHCHNFNGIAEEGQSDANVE